MLGIRPAQYLGDLSYSWYLWHWPCIVFAAALWPTTTHSGLYAAGFSLLPAWLAYRLVESPIRFTPQLYREGIYTIMKDHFGTHNRDSSQPSSRFPQLSRRSTSHNSSSEHHNHHRSSYERRADDADKASNGYGHYGTNGHNGGSHGHAAYGGENGGGARERI